MSDCISHTEASFLDDDPTLAGCCQREEEERKKTLKLIDYLSENDPAARALNARREAFRSQEAIQKNVQGEKNAHSHNVIPPTDGLKITHDEASDSEIDSDFEDDEFFSMLQASRRLQIEKQAAINSSSEENFVEDASIHDIIRLIQSSTELDNAVCLIRGQDTGVSVCALEFLIKLSSVHRKTRFFSVEIDSNGIDNLLQVPVPKHCRIRQLPCFISFFNSNVVDTFTDFEDYQLNGFWNDRVLPWLFRCRVVTHQNFDKDSREDRNAEHQISDTDASGAEYCDVTGCRLRYMYSHDHIGSSSEIRKDIASWRS